MARIANFIGDSGISWHREAWIAWRAAVTEKVNLLETSPRD
jgi:hypothetical protein